jgi:hypothetical protein
MTDIRICLSINKHLHKFECTFLSDPPQRYVPAMPAGERVTGAEGMTKAWAVSSRLELAKAATKKEVQPCMAEDLNVVRL